LLYACSRDILGTEATVGLCDGPTDATSGSKRLASVSGGGSMPGGEGRRSSASSFAAHCKQKDAGTLVLLLGAPSDSS